MTTVTSQDGKILRSVPTRIMLGDVQIRKFAKKLSKVKVRLSRSKIARQLWVAYFAL